MFKCCYQVGRNFPPEYIACGEPADYLFQGYALCLIHLQWTNEAAASAMARQRLIQPN